MESFPFDGVCVVGKFVGVEPIRYGASHAARAGEAVPGLHRLLVAVSEYPGDWPVSCGYATTDRITHEPTPASRDVERLGLSPGERVACRVAARVNKSYVNYDLIRVARLPDGATEEAGRGPGRSPDRGRDPGGTS